MYATEEKEALYKEKIARNVFFSLCGGGRRA